MKLYEQLNLKDSMPLVSLDTDPFEQTYVSIIIGWVNVPCHSLHTLYVQFLFSMQSSAIELPNRRSSDTVGIMTVPPCCQRVSL